MANHKRLKEYSVFIDGKLSKIVEFSKGEAELYVKNFIESRLTHAVVKATSALQNIKAYFSDTGTIKSQLEEKISTLIAGINAELRETVDEAGNIINNLTEEQKDVLQKAKEQLETAKDNIASVVDDSDFNKENINEAKNNVSDAIENLINNGIQSLTIGNDNDPSENNEVTTIDLSTEKRTLSNGLNQLQKWQLDTFEEEYSAEIYTDQYHDYKYAKNIEELCEVVNTTLKSLGAIGNLNYELYELDKENGEVIRHSEKESAEEELPIINIEEDIKSALTDANILYKRIDIGWQDKNYDPDEDGFTYGGN